VVLQVTTESAAPRRHGEIAHMAVDVHEAIAGVFEREVLRHELKPVVDEWQELRLVHLIAELKGLRVGAMTGSACTSTPEDSASTATPLSHQTLGAPMDIVLSEGLAHCSRRVTGEFRHEKVGDFGAVSHSNSINDGE
jgi:hypothetical protein